jgi:hypothetical protein
MEKLYTYGPEEAKAIMDAKATKKVDKGVYSLEYVDMPKAIAIMREFRKNKGLGNKVEIVLKKEVKLRKQASFQKSIRTMVCPYTRLTFGIFNGMNPVSQAPNWSTIELDEYKAFDLSNDVDAANWIICRMAPYIENSCNSHKFNDTPYWEFNDIRASNSNIVTKAAEIVKITQIIEKMSGSDMVNLARLFEFQVSPGDEASIQIIDIQGFLLNIALNDPEAFMLKYKNGNRPMLEMIYAGQAVGIVQYTFGSGYSALGNPIGLTVEEAVSTLRKDKNLHSLIRQEVISTDILSKRMEEVKHDVVKRSDVIAGAENPYIPVGAPVNEEDQLL